MDEYKNLENISKSLSAILMVLVEFRDSERKNHKGPKIEILLTEAGFRAQEISKIVGKNLSAVQKTIQRGRK